MVMQKWTQNGSDSKCIKMLGTRRLNPFSTPTDKSSFMGLNHELFTEKGDHIYCFSGYFLCSC